MGIERKTALAHKSNFGGVRAYSAIKYIVLHYTANDGDHDESNAKYFQAPDRHASVHYFVDDDSITQSVPDNYVAWSVGGKKYTDCAQTGGGKLYGVATNANSISIEMCDTIKDGRYQATEATMANAAMLCRELMDKYGVDIDHVIRHFDVTGKHCPVYFMDQAAWQGFKDRLRRGQFTAGKVYVTTRACYLRGSAGVQAANKVKYKALPETVRKKCRKKPGNAVLKKGQKFRLAKVKCVGTDVWGKIGTGYWIPLMYKGKDRVRGEG